MHVEMHLCMYIIRHIATAIFASYDWKNKNRKIGGIRAAGWLDIWPLMEKHDDGFWRLSFQTILSPT